jgi:hypothetical protein
MRLSTYTGLNLFGNTDHPRLKALPCCPSGTLIRPPIFRVNISRLAGLRWRQVFASNPCVSKKHQTAHFNCASPCSSRLWHAAGRIVSRHWRGSVLQRGPAPSPCCRARAHGEGRVAPGRPGWIHTAPVVGHRRQARPYRTSFRLIAHPRDRAASFTGAGVRATRAAICGHGRRSEGCTLAGPG